MEDYKNDLKRIPNVTAFMNLVFAGVNMMNRVGDSLQSLQHYFDDMGLECTEISEEDCPDTYIMDIYYKNIRVELEKVGTNPITVLNFYKYPAKRGEK